MEATALLDGSVRPARLAEDWLDWFCLTSSSALLWHGTSVRPFFLVNHYSRGSRVPIISGSPDSGWLNSRGPSQRHPLPG
jgi:hypothetical protein